MDEEKGNNENNIHEVINKCMDNKTFMKVEVEGKVIEVFPISYVLRKDGLYLYCYDDDYKLILESMVSNALECERHYEGKIIKYKDNKENLKYYSNYSK